MLFVIKTWAWQGQSTSVLPLPDSVNQALDRIGFESSKMDYLLGLVNQYQYQDPPFAVRLAQEALIRSFTEDDKEREALVYYWLAWLEFQNNPGPFDSALASTSKSILELPKYKKPYWLARAYGLRAAIAFDMSKDSINARDDLAAGMALVQKIKNKPSDSLWVLAYLNTVKGNVNGNDLATQMTSLNLFELAGDSVRVGRTCVKLSAYCMAAGKKDLAEAYISRATAAYATTPFNAGKKEAFLSSLNFLLHVYQQTRNEDYFDRLVNEEKKHLTTIGNDAELLSKFGVAYALKAYFESNNPAVASQYLMVAQKYFEDALPVAVATHDQSVIKLVTTNLLQYCETFQNCDAIRMKVIEIYANELAYKNSLTATSQHGLEKYYQAERLSTVDSERQKQRNFLLGLTVVFLLSTLCFIIFDQRRKSKILNRELHSKMEALRAQMNPHFISNTLNAIDSLVNHNRNKEASYYIIQFSRLCRIILNNSRSETITLAEELETLRYFLNLEKLRLGEKLSFDIESESTLNKDNIALPPMILQPFVENAIWHGIQPNNVPGIVTVKVKRVDQQTFQCIIEDNGIGREKSKEYKKHMVITQPSHGLAITEERLETIKKIKGSDLFTEDLYDAEGAATGTRVTITLPV